MYSCTVNPSKMAQDETATDAPRLVLNENFSSDSQSLVGSLVSVCFYIPL